MLAYKTYVIVAPFTVELPNYIVVSQELCELEIPLRNCNMDIDMKKENKLTLLLRFGTHTLRNLNTTL